jgi:hypothetical protein
MSGAGGTRLDMRNVCLARADKIPGHAHQADGSPAEDRRSFRIGDVTSKQGGWMGEIVDDTVGS